MRQRVTGTKRRWEAGVQEYGKVLRETSVTCLPKGMEPWGVHYGGAQGSKARQKTMGLKGSPAQELLCESEQPSCGLQD